MKGKETKFPRRPESSISPFPDPQYENERTTFAIFYLRRVATCASAVTLSSRWSSRNPRSLRNAVKRPLKIPSFLQIVHGALATNFCHCLGIEREIVFALGDHTYKGEACDSLRSFQVNSAIFQGDIKKNANSPDIKCSR